MIEDKEKREIVNKALEGCATILLLTMKALDAPNFIEGSIVNDVDGQKYELMFRRIQSKKEETIMSIWHGVNSQEDVELSEDGETIDVLFNHDYNGNNYVSIPIEFIKNVLPTSPNKEKTK